MRGIIYRIVALVSVTCIILISASYADTSEGEKLFKTTCVACHTIGKGRLVGPDLKDVHTRKPEDWQIKWIRNSTEVINSGDEYGRKLFEEFNKVMMPANNFTDDQIKSILSYIKAEGEKAATAQTTPVPSGETPSGTEIKSDKYQFYLLAGILTVLIILFLILRNVVQTLAVLAARKKGLPVPETLPLGKDIMRWVSGHKRIVALVIIILFAFGSGKAWYWMLEIGVEQGYEPAQPIQYSHKIHAGDNGIQCVYCHFGAEKSKTAGIPPALVCMNCHKYIKTGKQTGTTEIAKIYAALDYNPDKGTYGNNPKPIEWVRVHNLPDLAYFNHSQHVTVGKIACQTCHGPVQTMEVMRQEKTLTMGWCVDCHRKTEVALAENPYYKKLHEVLAQRLNKNTFTVEDMGGTDCVKCHY
ncbi:MAG: c-type cytochrome [Bacteroidetes bacterium]|nr:c-type cytochrome [Bacteroidota bacterium]